MSSVLPPRPKQQQLPMNTIIKFVPQQEAWIVERFGRFDRQLQAGLNILYPLIDRISYVKSLKEHAIPIGTQSAITQDNVAIQLDGVLYYRIVDAYKAAYGVTDHEYAVTQLAQTTMRAEIGRLSLDEALGDRQLLNSRIVLAINSASAQWGVECLRHEIRDITPPHEIIEAMHTQVSADRRKRALILESEGRRQALINDAEGRKQATILSAEADRMQLENRARGEAESIKVKAVANAESIARVADTMAKYGSKQGAGDAVALKVAEQYLDAFRELAQKSTTVLMDSNSSGGAAGGGGVNDPAAMVAKALSVYNSISPGSAMAGSASDSAASKNGKTAKSTVSRSAKSADTFPLN